MKITTDYAEGYTLDGVKILNNGRNDVVSLTPNQMWQIYEHMKRINIKQQIESYLESGKDDEDYFENIGRTVEDMLNDEELLESCVEDVNDGSYGDLEDEDIYMLLERYA